MDHETLDYAEYVRMASQLLNLRIQEEYQESVTENFARLAEVAKLLTEFPLSEKIEPAPVFEP